MKNNLIGEFLVTKVRVGDVLSVVIILLIFADLVFHFSGGVEGDIFRYIPSSFGFVYWVTLFAVATKKMREIYLGCQTNGILTYTLVALLNILNIVWICSNCIGVDRFSIPLFLACYVVGIGCLLTYYYFASRYYLATPQQIHIYYAINLLLVIIGNTVLSMLNDGVPFAVYCLPTNGMFFYPVMEDLYHWVYFLHVAVVLIAGVVSVRMFKHMKKNESECQ